MKYIRFLWKERAQYGCILEPDIVEMLPGAPWLPSFKRTDKGERLSLSALRLLSPCEPGNIVCVGKNFREHIKEFDGRVPENPIVFLKPRGAANDPGAFIDLPPEKVSSRVDYEGELAFVMGKTARGVSREEASQYIFGFTLFNDVTARDLQHRDGQWTRSKGFDGFAPFGPWIDSSFSPDGRMLETRLNGKTVQQGAVEDMIFSVAELVEFITDFMTLLPGDIVAAGTPAGVGPLSAGDVVEVTMEGLGTLRNHVRQTG